MKLDDEADAWELEDAEERQRNAPDMYLIPDEAERRTLQVGDQAALLFRFRGKDRHGAFVQCERLFVTIREVLPNGYFGVLDSTPVCSTLIRPGDSVTFEPCHVSRIKRC